MTNPIFTNNPAFRETRRDRVRTSRTLAATGAMSADAAALERMYGAPPATSRDTGRMTYDDVIVKTGGLLALLVVVAGVTYQLAPELFFVGMIVGLVLGLVNAFKREPSPGLIVAYTVAQGVFLGGLSHLVQAMVSTPGVAADSIVVQALLATAATFVAALLLFSSGKVRVTPRSTRFLLIAMTGYLLFSLVNVALVWFGGMDGWGLRSEVSVMGIPLGVLVGILAVGLAAYSLIIDFDSIKRGVEQGAPARYAWTASFGLIVTLVWLYVEFLRIFAILRDN